MSRASLTDKCLGFLRRFRTLYAILRTAKRLPGKAAVTVLRRVLPDNCPWGPVKGCFSACALVREKGIAGEIILEKQEVADFGPGTLVRLSNLGQDKHQPWPVFWSLHRNARLVGPNLAHVDSQKLGCIEAMYGSPYFKEDQSYNYIAHNSPAKLAGNWTSIVCRWGYGGYWHFLMDALPRLALLGGFPNDTQIIAPVQMGQWRRDFLDMMGLAGRYHEVGGRHLLLENYYFSSPTAMTGCYNPYAVHFLRQTYLGNADPGYHGPKKFYIVRENWTRGIVNDLEVRELLESRGWALIAPEKLSIPAQIQLFSEAEAVCGLHGSALTNILWAAPGCRVLELCPSTFFAGAFEWVAEILRLRHDFLICEADSYFRARVDLAALQRKLNALEL